MSILLSGGTGFLARAYLRSVGEPVVALIRPPTHDDRARSLARRLGIDISAVAGDIRSPRWGLDDATIERLRGEVRLVANFAVQSSWAASWTSLMSTNVDGARNAVDVAAALGVPLLHISSLYAAYGYSRYVPEALVDEQPHLSKYERSKCRGEWAVADRAAELGVPTWIVRVGALGGDLKVDPETREKTSAPVMARLIDSDSEGWAPYALGARLDLAPRDLVAERIVAITSGEPTDDLVVKHVCQGHSAPHAGAILAEASRQGMGNKHKLRPVPVPARVLMEVSEMADRFGRGRRTNLLIGARYFCSKTVFLSDGLGQEVSLPDLVSTLVRKPKREPTGLPEFYVRWL
ncbi:MAG TPA: SDR family oxidoreductase [Acidimicrobiales bacterium]|jgi:nucleoside-diphosphate-sugar epimerase